MTRHHKPDKQKKDDKQYPEHALGLMSVEVERDDHGYEHTDGHKERVAYRLAFS